MLVMSPKLAANGLQLQEGRDFTISSFGELNFRLAQMCLRSTKPRLLGRCCYKLPFYLSLLVCTMFCRCVCAVGQAYSIASFGSWSGLQMCMTAAWAGIYLYSITLSNIPITLKVFSFIALGSITIS